MKYRRLGKTGLKVNVVGVGTYQYGGEWGKLFTEDDVLKIFRAAEESGINLVDMAECYGDHLAEKLVGAAISKKRDRWVVATKFGHEFHSFQNRTRNFTASGMQEQLEGSLRALHIDYVDLYQIHSPLDPEFDNDTPWEMLDRQVKAGKVRFLGLSLSRQTDQESLEHQVQRAVEYGVSVIQLMYNRLSRTPEEKILPLCRENDLGVFARVPLASGVLTGKYAPGTTFSKNDLRSQRDQVVLQQQLREAGSKSTRSLRAQTWPRGRLPGVCDILPFRASSLGVRTRNRWQQMHPRVSYRMFPTIIRRRGGIESMAGTGKRHWFFANMKTSLIDIARATVDCTALGNGNMAPYLQPIADALKGDNYDAVISLESVYQPDSGTFEDGFRASIGRMMEVFD